jgi:dynein heavy chain
MVQTFHTQTEISARKFKQQLKRIYYVTPTSYLELISTFKILLEEKRKEVEALRDRYANGYDCLIKTEGSVSIM